MDILEDKNYTDFPRNIYSLPCSKNNHNSFGISGFLCFQS